jgi:hypothetical protein
MMTVVAQKRPVLYSPDILCGVVRVKRVVPHNCAFYFLKEERRRWPKMNLNLLHEYA